MNFRPLIAALAAASLFACGQNIVAEDENAVVGDNTSRSDEVKGGAATSGGGGGGKAPAAIPMKVQSAAAQPGPFATSFSINATRDLFFAFDMPSTKTGSHVAAYEIFTPGGAVYQRNEVLFAAGQAAVGAEVQAEVISGGFRTWSSIPVAATVIQQLAMTGTWAVKVQLDGVQVASSTFTLNP